MTPPIASNAVLQWDKGFAIFFPIGYSVQAGARPGELSKGLASHQSFNNHLSPDLFLHTVDLTLPTTKFDLVGQIHPYCDSFECGEDDRGYVKK